MADLSFHVEPRVLIGIDVMNRLGMIAGELGGRVLVVTEPALYETKAIDRLVGILEDAQVEAIVFDEVPAQATADIAERAAKLARGARCTAVLAMGGIKTVSTGRLAALLAAENAYLFDVLDGEHVAERSLPLIAVPTAGRDSFILTDRFVVVDPRDRSVRIVPTPKAHCAALVFDPGISETLSRSFSATTVLDGFCAAFEAYCSSKANFFSDALLERSMEIYFRIMDAIAGEARSFDIAGTSVQAGFLASFGAASSAPGVGTALAYAINARFPVAKSWVSAALLPYVMELFLPARVEKLAKIAALAGEPIEGASVSSSATMAVESIRKRIGRLKVPARLKDIGLQLDRLSPAADAARALDFVAYAARPLSADDIFDILKQAY